MIMVAQISFHSLIGHVLGHLDILWQAAKTSWNCVD